jgi:hypothetical protein
MTIFPPCAVASPILAAGFPPINMDEEPWIIMSGGPLQVQVSPRTAAGCPPMSTVALPPGNTGPPA